MKKLVKLGKNSFTLFETLISIFLLSIIIASFSKSSYYDNFDEEYMLLNTLENSFNTNTYSSDFQTTNSTIKIIKNSSDIEILNIKKTTFSNEKIVLSKHKLP